VYDSAHKLLGVHCGQHQDTHYDDDEHDGQCNTIDQWQRSTSATCQTARQYTNQDAHVAVLARAMLFDTIARRKKPLRLTHHALMYYRTECYH
jgi:hypothetical protein